MKFLLFTIPLLIILFSCNNTKESNTKSVLTKHSNEIWADTIIYEVLIKNPDSLDEWKSQKVKYVDQQKLVNNIFKLVYSGKKQAFNYYTNKPLSIDDIKNLEKEEDFKRDNVGKLQFKETWTFNDKTLSMNKKIYSILLAYSVYNETGELRGYKAAFYIKNI